MKTLENKFALVTGAGSGIGKAASIALAMAGFQVFLVGRRLEPLEDVAQHVASNNGKAYPQQADISVAEDVDRLFVGVEKIAGRLDVLFNNAGSGTPSQTIDEIDIEDWKNVVGVNLHGSFYCARAAFGLMKRQAPKGGRIINNGSISAYVPRPGSVPYTATKHAILGLTKTLALDGRPYNITCGQIDIGNAATDMTERMQAGVPQADGSMKSEPTFDVKHVAAAVVHMATLPLDVNILSMNVMAATMPYVGRG